MNIAGFVITLERAVERRPQRDWILANAPFECEPLNAVDGVAMTEGDVTQIYQRQIFSPRYPHALRRGEIGCFLSHRKAWQEIVDRGLEAAVILEDDVSFNPDDLRQALNFLRDYVQPNDYIQFQVREIENSFPPLAQAGQHSIVQPCPVILRTTAQLVTREAASRLLEVTRCIDRPVDTFLQMTWITGVPVKMLLPRVIQEISQNLGGSTLGGRKKPWMEKFTREILRPIYRTQIWYRALQVSQQASAK
ncbi:MAG: glycosyl transferase [Planctomycetota bacterium]|jgi:GR25 family glycosyltransferase involved in LPS biosynthesis|nr:glycosyltransferase family 25 protein [Planctomycetales bacterium]RLT09688.1 MAG: glycosyl transferase [Planctomycetota bacterium]